MPKHITDYFIYRWRYVISYGLIGIIVLGFLAIAVLFAPGGLSDAEKASAIASTNLSIGEFKPEMAINFPYALLQYLAFSAFGVTALSIKAPSIILGVIAGIGIILLMRSWFYSNVAIIATLIALTSSQFIFTTQNGTPAIMYILLPVWLLLTAMMVSREIGKRSFWEFLLMATLALSLYTPLMVYVIMALLSATVLHPHLRFIVGRLSKQKLIIAGMTALLLLAPLITALVLQPSLGLELIGVPESLPDLKANGLRLTNDYFSFLSPGTGEQIRPIYTLTTLLFVLLGFTRLLTTKYTARSYIITSWVILLVPVLLFNPHATTTSFVPVMLLVAMGGEVILSRWYKLFPRNPYARIAGLVPITVLIAGMTLGGVERYIYGYHYSPTVREHFSSDLSLINSQIDTRNSAPMTLVVAESEIPFYESVSKYKKGVTVLQPRESVPGGLFTVATRTAFHERKMSDPTKIITNGMSEEADRLYLYNSAP